MLKFSFSFSLLFLFTSLSMAQRPNYAEDIASIIYTNCSGCHRQGEIAPFPLTNFAEVSAQAATISFVVDKKYMPPWLPNHTYQQFLDQKLLTETEIQTITTWASSGAPRGNPALEPAFPTFPTGSQLGTPDLVLNFNSSYTTLGNNTDDYRVFVLPTNLSSNKDIAAVEFRPGNNTIAHHAIMVVDTSGLGRQLDAVDSTYGYAAYGGFGGVTPAGALAAWSPGQIPRFAPPGFGTKLFKNSDVLIQMHYGPSPIAQKDSSTINIFYSKVPVNRQVYFFDIKSSNTGVPFVIPADSVTSFHATFTSPFDVSLMFIYPHAHLLCKNWLAYGIKPNGDTINLVKIDEWAFNWQAYYTFPNLIKVPAGTVLHVFTQYDNTSNNPANPFSPPQTAYWGEKTTDEMLLMVFGFVFYQPGDELIAQSTDIIDNAFARTNNYSLNIFPNPVLTGDATWEFMLGNAQVATIHIFDALGKCVSTVSGNTKFYPGLNKFHFSSNNLSSGKYTIRFESENTTFESGFVIIRQ